jgi:hypothetical protein
MLLALASSALRGTSGRGAGKWLLGAFPFPLGFVKPKPAVKGFAPGKAALCDQFFSPVPDGATPQCDSAQNRATVSQNHSRTQLTKQRRIQ